MGNKTQKSISNQKQRQIIQDPVKKQVFSGTDNQQGKKSDNKSSKKTENQIHLEMILNATRSQILFHGIHNQGYEPTVLWQSNLNLPTLYSFRSSHQINKNILNIDPVVHQTITYNMVNMPTLQHNYPKSCIGLVLCDITKITRHIMYMVQGYSYTIRQCQQVLKMFIVVDCINNMQISNLQLVQTETSAVEYMMLCEYIILWNILNRRDMKIMNFLSYSYMMTYLKVVVMLDGRLVRIYKENGNHHGSINLRSLRSYQQLEQYERGLIKEENQFYIMEFQKTTSSNYNGSSRKIRNIVNQWTSFMKLDIKCQNFSNLCDKITKYTTKNLREIDLSLNNIKEEGCKYLVQADWPYLTNINLNYNKISGQGCKYISQANWTHLTHIYLSQSNIDSETCKQLSKANWRHLTNINLYSSNIEALGCKYLSKANWTHLTNINLNQNKIGKQGCKYLSQANWIYLNNINLKQNSIGAQGCKYLSQAKWSHLTTINLSRNRIGSEDSVGCKYLSQTNWKHLNNIYLCTNNIDQQDCKYLRQGIWAQLNNMDLTYNHIYNVIDKIILKEQWPQIHF